MLDGEQRCGCACPSQKWVRDNVEEMSHPEWDTWKRLYRVLHADDVLLLLFRDPPRVLEILPRIPVEKTCVVDVGSH